MIGMVDAFEDDFQKAGFDVKIPEFTQEMSEDALCEIIGEYDGWIIGDDPATRRVLEAGTSGRLKACMRWGVGTNNLDFQAFKDYQIPIENTRGVFGREVSDLACHYVTALARETFSIDTKVKQGDWYKPIGQSLWNASALIVGFGDIGQNLAKRLLAHEMKVNFYDPFVTQLEAGKNISKVTWPNSLSHVDYVIFTVPLNVDTRHMLNDETLKYMRQGIKIINVARGEVIDETALVRGLRENIIKSAALDVFEKEPYTPNSHSHLSQFSKRLILGSHNGSNTFDAVKMVSLKCIERLKDFLNDVKR